jgi:hypothetical protein
VDIVKEAEGKVSIREFKGGSRSQRVVAVNVEGGN